MAGGLRPVSSESARRGPGNFSAVDASQVRLRFHDENPIDNRDRTRVLIDSFNSLTRTNEGSPRFDVSTTREFRLLNELLGRTDNVHDNVHATLVTDIIRALQEFHSGYRGGHSGSDYSRRADSFLMPPRPSTAPSSLTRSTAHTPTVAASVPTPVAFVPPSASASTSIPSSPAITAAATALVTHVGVDITDLERILTDAEFARDVLKRIRGAISELNRPRSGFAQERHTHVTTDITTSSISNNTGTGENDSHEKLRQQNLKAITKTSEYGFRKVKEHDKNADDRRYAREVEARTDSALQGNPIG